jgi:hypothetical protein
MSALPIVANGQAARLPDAPHPDKAAGLALCMPAGSNGLILPMAWIATKAQLSLRKQTLSSESP